MPGRDAGIAAAINAAPLPEPGGEQHAARKYRVFPPWRGNIFDGASKIIYFSVVSPYDAGRLLWTGPTKPYFQ
jgi:hypothetical protein